MTDSEVIAKDAGPDPAAYTVVPIPIWIRIAKALLPLLVAVPLGVIGLVKNYERGTLPENIWVMAIILGAGFWGAYKLFSKSEKIVLTATIVLVPIRDRLKKAGLAAGLTALACGVVWAMQYTMGYFDQYWTNVWPFPLVGGCVVLVSLLDSRVRVITPEANLYVQRMQHNETLQRATSAEHFERVFSYWWIRYPLAVLIVWGATVISESPKEKAGWLIVTVAVIVAVWLAREISLLLLGIGAIWLLFKGVAALPVSVAVIIGAMIIAGSMRR